MISQQELAKMTIDRTTLCKSCKQQLWSNALQEAVAGQPRLSQTAYNIAAVLFCDMMH